MPYLNPRGANNRGAAAARSRTHLQAPGDAPQQSRVRQLEELVHVLKRELDKRGGLGSIPEADHAPESGSGPGVPETPGDLSGVTEPAPAGPITNEQRYVDAANWEAISDDVRGLGKTNVPAAVEPPTDKGRWRNCSMNSRRPTTTI